jgi:hypothetical protein
MPKWPVLIKEVATVRLFVDKTQVLHSSYLFYKVGKTFCDMQEEAFSENWAS